MPNNLFRKALTDISVAVLYVVAVSSFMYFAPFIFGPGKTILIPITMLILLVLSASITGVLVFGRSAMWYMDGNKKEAVSLLVYKLMVMIVYFVVALFLLYVIA